MMSGPFAPEKSDPITIHASCVAYDQAGLLILGASGAGKSSLALQLIGYGAVLVCDDQTQLSASNGILTARAPLPIRGLIEARGVGLLKSETVDDASVRLVVDLDHDETNRLPEQHVTTLIGVSLPCIHKVDAPYFPAAVLQYLKHGI